ncbi:MAG: TIR domain-containing protein [Methanothrix sp.]|nr:TIR domain-containing protein [Methanothrix sp.]
MGKIGEIFISHTHPDAEIAQALSDAIEGVFGDLLITSYSTKMESDGGIKPGEDWFRWIVQKVRTANIAVILLTPTSVQKPWILWEAGAVYGAGIASEQSNARKVRPLIYNLSNNQVPSPFANIQGVHGDQFSGIERFLIDLIEDFAPLMEKNQLVNAGKMLGPTIDRYLDQIRKGMRNAPLIPTEAAIQEWCQRLDELIDQNRISEIEYIHDWLNLTFGRDRDEQPLPLDLRLHRRLGNAYRAAKVHDKAAQEFRLALELAPRDIFLLRNLGLSYLDDKKKDEASKVINRIAELDKYAFVRNTECAALKARLERENNSLESAAETYRNALNFNPASYYLADVLGQTLLDLGKIDEAKTVFSRAIDIINSLNERNIWIYATLATSSLVLNKETDAVGYLRNIAELRPDPDDIDRIISGLERIQKRLNMQISSIDSWREILRGGL